MNDVQVAEVWGPSGAKYRVKRRWNPCLSAADLLSLVTRMFKSGD
jgi:hypothetical protein